MTHEAKAVEETTRALVTAERRVGQLCDSTDEAFLLLVDAQEALDDVGAKGHLPCAYLAGRIARFLAQNREPT